MARNGIDVVIADSQPVLRLGVATVVSQNDDMRVVAEAGTLEDARRLVESLRPDVLTLDIRMGQWCGGSLCREIRELAACSRVLILSSSWDDHTLARSIQAGASGYLLKSSDPSSLPDAIRTVARGELVFDPAVADAVARTLHQRRAPRTGLTDQERNVLELVSRGMTNKSIATTLFLSPHTVKDYLSSIMAKLQAKNRAEAVLMAARDHLI